MERSEDTGVIGGDVSTVPSFFDAITIKIAFILAIIPCTFAAVFGVVGLGDGILFRESFIDRPVLYMFSVLWFVAIPIGAMSLWTVVCVSDRHLKSLSLKSVVILNLGLLIAFGNCLYFEILRWTVTNALSWRNGMWVFSLVPMVVIAIQLFRLWKISHKFS